MEDELIIKAKPLHEIFYNKSNGYGVFKFKSYDAEEKKFIATGSFNELDFDYVYCLYGKYVDHPKFGIQFQVSSCQKAIPSDDESLIRFFSSDLFPGIGKQTAIAIVNTLGNKAVELIRNDSNVLFEIPLLTEKRREVILKGIKEYVEEDETTFFFTKYGISTKNIKKIEYKYGSEAIDLIKENPYRIIEDIDGIGFKTADKLAKSLNFDLNHPYRIKAAVLSAVSELNMKTGDTYVTYEDLELFLGKQFSSVNLDEYLNELEDEYLVVREENRIYHYTQYDSEIGIASFLKRFPYENQDDIEKNELIQEIDKLQKELHIQYEKKQIEAILNFFSNAFSILTGGPGTGKTTIVQGIIKLYKKYYPMDQIAICAPTGRASKRLSELCNCSATTIHSLLHWDLETNKFLINEKETLTCDLLIIDEFSMVDQWLFYNLLKASKFVKKIFIIGDENQLPSVGCGCVLKDLIDSQKFMVTNLSKIFRQAKDNDVITLAHEIKNENVTILEHARDIAFFSASQIEIKSMILKIVSNALDKGYSDEDIQVLAPIYAGVAGIDILNKELQKIMNPQSSYKREITVGYRVFREGDKVLQLKNQPDDNVYNGDIGKIVEIVYANDTVDKKQRIIVDFDDNYVEYSGEQLFNITHAFCISIHKSQGSEYPIVILPIIRQYSYILCKRLIYTAVTRAKKSLVLLGEQDVFYETISKKDQVERKSTLKNHIISIFSE